ncbi:hypothetical protein Slin15195_G095790 [Septoria linicola]|uniref:Uncharacterized protein n=1 Tax=Septoria linicola TaxID=215465 RepID=A0A9Q9B142_9PEZI|nr:hypothetical protein Slin14017_G058880 [Septoria linicola]USW56260.1 hypothetical protein Slin15195_G095790 [Septoria linicola]
MVCYPAIPRVNKQVHKEAEAVLYGENIATIRISIHGSRSAYPQRKVQIFRQDFPSEPGLLFPRETQSTLGRSFMWPEYLLKFRNVDVSLSFSVDPWSRAAHHITSTQRLRKSLDTAANHELCGLMSTLGTSIALKRVALKVVHEDGLEDGLPRSTGETQRLEELLWPIGQLQNIEELAISGVPEGMESRLKQITLPPDSKYADVL